MQTQPLHTALLAAEWPRQRLYRWLIAWWYYRSSGLACWIAQLDDGEFWARMTACAYSTTTGNPLGQRIWPRGEGQEWFRGAIAVEAIRSTQFTWGDRPEDMVQSFINGAPHCEEVMHRVLGYTALSACIVCTDLQCLGLCHIDIPIRLPIAYPPVDLRAELEPWSRHSELAATLLERIPHDEA